jgi:hypothetical protein
MGPRAKVRDAVVGHSRRLARPFASRRRAFCALPAGPDCDGTVRCGRNRGAHDARFELHLKIYSHSKEHQPRRAPLVGTSVQIHLIIGITFSVTLCAAGSGYQHRQAGTPASCIRVYSILTLLRTPGSTPPLPFYRLRRRRAPTSGRLELGTDRARDWLGHGPRAGQPLDATVGAGDGGGEAPVGEACGATAAEEGRLPPRPHRRRDPQPRSALRHRRPAPAAHRTARRCQLDAKCVGTGLERHPLALFVIS